jgi:hypothetical protein
MTSRKPKASKVQARGTAFVDAASMARTWVDENPDTQLVLEMAMRAQSTEPPRNIDMATDIAVTAPNSQYPVS